MVVHSNMGGIHQCKEEPDCPPYHTSGICNSTPIGIRKQVILRVPRRGDALAEINDSVTAIFENEDHVEMEGYENVLSHWQNEYLELSLQCDKHGGQHFRKANFPIPYIDPPVIGDHMRLIPRSQWEFSIVLKPSGYNEVFNFNSEEGQKLIVVGFKGRCYDRDALFSFFSAISAIFFSAISC
ncbi:hypothetical protein NPIL_22761 [Nephila pilipes]|uniref:Uncharacterized protein n=1 Tax=Nephila pilipes TaxID=299642 RepID=A0A8X6I6R8_NEPPI|nr:hypothetical protein NPIL_22761 [Nephila pilipes]